MSRFNTIFGGDSVGVRKTLHTPRGNIIAVVDVEKLSRKWAGESRRMRVRLYVRRFLIPWKVWDEEFDATKTTRQEAVMTALAGYEASRADRVKEQRRDEVDQNTFTNWTGVIKPEDLKE
jgi:hypothetical protein